MLLREARTRCSLRQPDATSCRINVELPATWNFNPIRRRSPVSARLNLPAPIFALVAALVARLLPAAAAAPRGSTRVPPRSFRWVFETARRTRRRLDTEFPVASLGNEWKVGPPTLRGDVLSRELRFLRFYSPLGARVSSRRRDKQRAVAARVVSRSVKESSGVQSFPLRELSANSATVRRDSSPVGNYTVGRVRVFERDFNSGAKIQIIKRFSFFSLAKTHPINLARVSSRAVKARLSNFRFVLSNAH